MHGQPNIKINYVSRVIERKYKAWHVDNSSVMWRVCLRYDGQSLCTIRRIVVICVRLLFVLFCVLFVCKCVLPPGDNPITVNNYINISISISIYSEHTLHCVIKVWINSYNYSRQKYQAVNQGCTSSGCQVTRTTKFCAVLPNICGPSIWNLPHITLLAPRILLKLLEGWCNTRHRQWIFCFCKIAKIDY